MFNYIKKEEYTGSMEGMRYMLRKKEGEEVRLEAVILAGALWIWGNSGTEKAEDGV